MLAIPVAFDAGWVFTVRFDPNRLRLYMRKGSFAWCSDARSGFLGLRRFFFVEENKAEKSSLHWGNQKKGADTLMAPRLSVPRKTSIKETADRRSQLIPIFACRIPLKID